MNKKVLWEAVKEPLRILILALIPFLVAYFAEINYEWAAVATLVLRFLDSYLHTLGKVEKKPTLVKGITRF